MEINKIYNENCLDTMSRMSDNFIDLTVTSPPYDNLRTYNGYSFDFESIAKELYRVTKEGGVVVWIVGDATLKGSETGTSFKQALFFKECGFNLHDTMIWQKNKIVPRDPRLNRYYQDFEYMFVFSKGKPKTCNYIMIDCIHKGKKARVKQRKTDGSFRDDRYQKMKNHIVKDKKIKSNTWVFSTTRSKHPAIFPEQLANDHIISWSNEGDLVYDCFMGSGTTAKMSILNNRKYIGSEMSEEYCDIIKQRLNSQQKELF
jgi:site-specific DNA-methyltransferase (adenine-specific)